MIGSSLGDNSGYTLRLVLLFNAIVCELRFLQRTSSGSLILIGLLSALHDPFKSYGLVPEQAFMAQMRLVYLCHLAMWTLWLVCLL